MSRCAFGVTFGREIGLRATMVAAPGFVDLICVPECYNARTLIHRKKVNDLSSVYTIQFCELQLFAE